MSTTQRRIEITGSDAGFGRMASNLASELERSFEDANQELERMSGNASEFTEILEGRLAAIESSINNTYSSMNSRLEQQKVSGAERIRQMRDEVAQAERVLRIETERARLAEKSRFQNEMRDINDNDDSTAEDRKAARETHVKNMQDINEDATVRLLQIRGLRSRIGDDQIEERNKAKQEEDSYSEKQNAGNAKSVVSGALKSVMGGVLSGLGIAGLFSIAGFIGKMLNEGIELDNAEASTRGLGMRGVGSAPGFGKKRSEMLEYSRGAALAAGRADYDALGNLAFEKRFSQDENSLLGLTAALRTSGGRRGAGDVAVEMLNYFKRSDLFNIKRGDFTQLGEKIQFNTHMLEMQGGQMMLTNATTNAQILELFGRAGIGDQRTMGFVENINQSIINPNNDFSKAFIFRSLRQRNPNMSLFELMKQQEQGIFGEGTFGQILGDLQSTFKGDQLKMSIAQLFGLKNFQAEQIAGMSPTEAARIGSQEDIEKYLKASGESPLTSASGAGGVGVMSRRMAQLNDWFAENGVQAIRKIDDYITTYEKKGFGGLANQMLEDITGAIKSGFKEATDYLKEQLSPEAIDKRLGLGKPMATDINGNPLAGTTSSVSNLFNKNMFLGGGTTEQKRSWIAQGFDYNQSRIMPPALTTYEPQYSRRDIGDFRGKDFVIMKGNDLAGSFKGKKVEAELPDKTYGQYTAAQIVQLFAYAVQNGLEKITLDQSKMILEQGFQPSIEVMKQLQLQNSSFSKNKIYSTEN